MVHNANAVTDVARAPMIWTRNGAGHQEAEVTHFGGGIDRACPSLDLGETERQNQTGHSAWVEHLLRQS